MGLLQNAIILQQTRFFAEGAEFTAIFKAHDNVRLHGTICTKVVGASIVVVSKSSAHLEKQNCRYNS